MKLKSPENREINLAVPKIAFQGDSNARLVAVLKSHAYSLPKKPTYVNGKNIGLSLLRSSKHILH